MDIKGFKRGISYSAMGNYTNLLIQLVVNMILSRILTPFDFGIVSIVLVFQEFFNMLSNMGIGPAIIQNKGLNESDINVLYKYSFILAIILAISFGLLGYPASLFYSNPVYINVFIILSVSVFFSSIIVVPQALLQKKKEFKKINNIIIIAGLSKGITAVLLALLNFSFYSILFGGLIQYIVTYFLYVEQNDLTLRSKLTVEPLHKIRKFASSQFVFNFVNYFSRNLDSLLIGRYFSSVSLAYYNKSFLLTRYPTSIFTGIITPVLQPLLSDYENELLVIKNTYLKISRILANIGIPISVFFYFNAEEIIILMYGNQWLNSIPTLKYLSLVIWIIMLSSSTSGIFQSSNRTDLLLISGIQSSIFNIGFIIIGISLGSIEYVSLMIVISYSINLLITNYLLMHKVFNSNFSEFFYSIGKPLIVGFMEICLFLIIPRFYFGTFINLIIKGLLFMFVFLLGMLITKQSKELIKIFKL